MTVSMHAKRAGLRGCLIATLAWSSVAVPSQASAEVHVYELHVEGAGCLFRAFGLERALARLEEVRRVELDPATGAIRMTLGPDATVMPTDLEEKVEEAGLSVISIDVVARGTVRGSAEGGRLSMGGQRALMLVAGPGTDRLRKLVADGQRSLEIRGRLRRHGDGWGVVVESVREPETPEDEQE